MDYATPPPEPPPLKPWEDPSLASTIAHAPRKKPGLSFYLTFVVLPLLIAAIVVPAVQKSQTLTGEAAGKKCRFITRVAISPGKIETYPNYPPTNLSVLAYDYYGVPVTEGVQYEWGMSSTSGIGTVKARGDLASFIPVRPGTGDLYVKTKNSCTKKAVIGSINVAVLAPPPQNTAQ